MGRFLIVLGVIFIVIGYALIISGISYKVKIVISQTERSETNRWEVSKEFSAGSRLVLDIAPGQFWWIWFEPASGLIDWPLQADAALVEITIVDPHGGKTNITMYYAKVQTVGQEPSGKFFGATINSNDGGLYMEEEYKIQEVNKTKYYNYNNKFGAITKYSGTYRAFITNQHEGFFLSPPAKFTMIEQKLREERPYFCLIPIGGVIIAVGVVFILVNRKFIRKTPRKR